jgi:hypothetical protein
MRDLQLTLLANGGAELLDMDAPDDAEPVWASDSDEDFAEEFPEILDENDLEHVQDYLEEKEICTPRELEVMEIINEPLAGPGDPDDDDDCDDDDVSWDCDDDGDDTRDSDDDDVIEGEAHEVGT